MYICAVKSFGAHGWKETEIVHVEPGMVISGQDTNEKLNTEKGSPTMLMFPVFNPY